MKQSQRGFTLIELMVALVVSSLLVGMILAIFNRMSIAYRGQQQIAGVQQVLAAARATIELDAKQAGLELSQGFRYANDPSTPPVARSAVRVVDSSTGPDTISFFYADPTTQAAVTGGALPTVNVDSTSGFVVGDLVVMSRVLTTTPGVNAGVDANIATYEACVLKLTVIPVGAPPRLTFDTAAPWGRLGETHCTAALSSPTMIYKFVARSYRIDTSTPARAALGPLQQSQTGGLIGTAADNWTDLAYGFTDIQTALQIYDKASAPGDTTDPDADGDRDWYSDGAQTTLTGPLTNLTGTDGLLQMSISLVARTDRDVEGIVTGTTPLLVDPLNTSNNTIGNHASVSLPSATDPALMGPRIYRFTTFLVDLRNLGVGR